MNILFSSDDNYARHLGVAIYSLLTNNTNVANLRIFVVDNNISAANINKLQQITAAFDNVELIFIPFKKWSDSLRLNMSWPISLSSYARLFVGEMLPSDVDRVLYMDCDMLVLEDISELWNTNLDDNLIGAVQDQVSRKSKTAIGLDLSDNYFNAGLLLIDLKKWRDENMGEKCIQFIDEHEGRVIHHDQGVLNGLLKHRWLRLPLKFNVMTIHYILSYKKIKRYFKEKSSFYQVNDIIEAKNQPVILHYTPSFTSHPWEHNCKHPLRYLYNVVQNMTPWADFPLENEKSPWYVKLINCYYRHFLIF